METFWWKRRTSSTDGQNTSQSCTEAHNLSLLMIKAPTFLRRQFKKTPKKMKKGKAAGSDDIASEMLTALGEFGIKEITGLLNIIHDTGEIFLHTSKVCVHCNTQKARHS